MCSLSARLCDRTSSSGSQEFLCPPLSALSVHLNHIWALWPIGTPAQASSSFVSRHRGLTSRLSESIESQRSVRRGYLCFLRSVGPTIHPNLWAQSLRKKTEIKPLDTSLSMAWMVENKYVKRMKNKESLNIPLFSSSINFPYHLFNTLLHCCI